MFYTQHGNPITAITTNSAIYLLTRKSASNRTAKYCSSLNKCIRKYIGHDKKRIALFLAQIDIEIAQWRDLGGEKRLMYEWGFGRYSVANPNTQYYTAFYGRGIMQLTWAGNYKIYGEFRAFPEHNGAYVEMMPHIAPRITTTSRHYTTSPGQGGVLMTWSPRFDPDFVASDPYAACDSGGFYWVSKPFHEGFSINRVCDRQYSPANVGFINVLVNGGGNGYNERQAYSAYTMYILTDLTDYSEAVLISPPHPHPPVRANLIRTE